MRFPSEFESVPADAYVPEQSAESTMAKRSIRSLIVTAVERNKALLANATSLVGTVGVASGLGFVYWAVAAKLFSPEAVGFGSASSSAMSLLGTVGMFGLGPMLMGELPRRQVRGPLVSASLIAAGIGSLILGLGFILIAPLFTSSFDFIAGSVGQIAIFMIGVVLTGISRTFDQACIGLLKGGLQLSRNLVLSIAKVALLPLSAFLVHDIFGVGIIISWVVGIVISLAWTAVRLKRGGTSIMPQPDWDSLRRLGKTTMAHNWLNLAIFVPPALMPVVVTALVSPAANASFYVSWMIANFLYIIPSSLSTVLFTVASADTAAMAGKLRFCLRVSLYLGAPGILVLFLGGHLILSIFGQSYAATGTIPLWLFAAAYLPTIPVSHYIAVCRATDKVSRAAVVLTTSSAVQVAAAAAGGVLGGLTGLSLALVGVKFVEGLITAPAVLRAMRGSGSEAGARSAEVEPRATQAERLPAGGARDVPARRSLDDMQVGWAQARSAVRDRLVANDELARRQREGMAALITMTLSERATEAFPVLRLYDQDPVHGGEDARPPQHHSSAEHDRSPSRRIPYLSDQDRYPAEQDRPPWEQGRYSTAHDQWSTPEQRQDSYWSDWSDR
jgi:O-antigen/teichoic acid export membrane protein